MSFPVCGRPQTLRVVLTMADRMEYMKDDNRPDLRLIALALRKTGEWLDLADSGEEANLHPLLDGDHTALEWAHAWMAAAIYVADLTEATTAELNEVSYGLDRHAPQDALF
jgi:hypothetical protein